MYNIRNFNGSRFMVFFMFLVCSGGQWWYRYVMQGRCASVIAPPATRRASYPRQARVAYTPARDTVVLHHLWKPYPSCQNIYTYIFIHRFRYLCINIFATHFDLLLSLHCGSRYQGLL